jgi:hypothetical protein
VQLAKEESLASLSKRSFGALDVDAREVLALREIGNELEAMWETIMSK